MQTVIPAIVLGLVFLILLGSVLWVVTPAYQALSLMWKSRNWLNVKGEITTTNISEQDYENETDRGTSHYTYYRPEVRFMYIVDDETYKSDQRVFGETPQFAKKQDAQKILKKYAMGAAVKVYYDPQNPATSVLEPRNLRPIARSLFWGFFIYLAAMFVFRMAIGILGWD